LAITGFPLEFGPVQVRRGHDAAFTVSLSNHELVKAWPDTALPFWMSLC
jgi:hypothetical protein